MILRLVASFPQSMSPWRAMVIPGRTKKCGCENSGGVNIMQLHKKNKLAQTSVSKSTWHEDPRRCIWALGPWPIGPWAPNLENIDSNLRHFDPVELQYFKNTRVLMEILLLSSKSNILKLQGNTEYPKQHLGILNYLRAPVISKLIYPNTRHREHVYNLYYIYIIL